MNTFSIRDLRERTGELIRTAEEGSLSVVTKNRHPVFIAVPFSDLLLTNGIGVSLAVKLYDDDVIPLGKAAQLANMSHEAFMAMLGVMGIPIVRYSQDEMGSEVSDFLR